MNTGHTDHILLLAAGRGTRMGGPKATMLIAGRPWWELQAARLARLNLPITWVFSPALLASLQNLPDAPRTVAADPAAPMFDSIMAGIDSLRADPPRGLFILPIDVPAPPPPVWHSLTAEPGLPAIPAYRGTHGHPVRLPWPWIEETLLSRAAAARPPSERRLDHLIAPVARIIETDDPSIMLNLNTPADVQAWLAADRCHP